MERIFNEEIKLISYEYEVKIFSKNKLERHIIEERIDPITGFKIRINKSIKNKPRSYPKLTYKSESCVFCNPEENTPDFEFTQKIYKGDSVLFANKYPYGKYHAVLVPNYKKHVKDFNKLDKLDLYNSFLLIKEFYEKIPEKEYNYIFINLNKGFPAGASQEHLHFQILIEKEPTNYFKIYLDKSKRYFDKYKRFFIEDYFNFEKQLNERFIHDGIIKLISSFAPFRNNELFGYVETFGIFFLSGNNFEKFIDELYNILLTYEKLYENFNMVIFDTTLLKDSRTYPIIKIDQRNMFDIGYMEIGHLEYIISSIPEETAKEFKENLKI
jgi:galactose-1-phosphate uridylyltransferase